MLLPLLLLALSAVEGPPPHRPQASPPPGAVCGDPALLGAALPPVDDGGGCGMAAPVRLASVAGVVLEPAAEVDCAVGAALAGWLKAVAPDFAARGGIASLTVVDAYSCRNRNRAATGKLSEHALGHAVDIGSLRLGDGTEVSVREGWAAPEWAAALHRAHDAACGPFGTVLGPDANALHADHLHFDVAARRSGPWCE